MSTTRNIPVAAPLVPVLCVLMVALAACYEPASTGASPSGSTSQCPYGSGYLDVVNPTTGSYDLFALDGAGRRYIATVGPSITRVEVTGTPLERGGVPQVIPTGNAASDSRALQLAQQVRVTRKCDRRE